MKRFLLIPALLLLMLLSGCALMELIAPEPTAEPTALPTAAPTPEPTAEPTAELTAAPTETPGVYAMEQMELAEGRMDEAIEFILENPIPFDSAAHPFVPADKRAELSEEEAALYDEMLEAAQAFEPVSPAGSDESVENALEALLFDHPEIEIYFTVQKQEDGWRSIYFLPEGRYLRPAEDMEEVKAQAEAFNAVGAYVASLVPEDFSVIDKYRVLAYYISINTVYCHVHGEVPRYATCAYGAVVNGYSICQGYALGFEYLCRMADLDCRRVRNAFNDENMHFWDIVTLDQGSYYVDVTWCDNTAEVYYQPEWFTWYMFTADKHHVSNDGTTTTGPAIDRRAWIQG